MNVLAGTSGFAFKEWKECKASTHMVITAGILVLTAAIILLTWGNYLGGVS